MKLLPLTTLLFLAVVLATGCNNDDDEPAVCTQADWVGTYSGTITCDSEPAQDVTLTITADGTDNVVLSYQTSTVSTLYDPLPFDNCGLDNLATGGGITSSVSVTLNGNDITLMESLSGGGFASDCTINATSN